MGVEGHGHLSDSFKKKLRGASGYPPQSCCQPKLTFLKEADPRLSPSPRWAQLPRG